MCFKTVHSCSTILRFRLRWHWSWSAATYCKWTNSCDAFWFDWVPVYHICIYLDRAHWASIKNVGWILLFLPQALICLRLTHRSSEYCTVDITQKCVDVSNPTIVQLIILTHGIIWCIWIASVPASEPSCLKFLLPVLYRYASEPCLSELPGCSKPPIFYTNNVYYKILVRWIEKPKFESRSTIQSAYIIEGSQERFLSTNFVHPWSLIKYGNM